MSDPIVISDGEDLCSPLASVNKKPRTLPGHVHAILISDTEPTPHKTPATASSIPSFVADTPMSDGASVVKCSIDAQARVSDTYNNDKFSGKRVISLESESDDESGSSSVPKCSKENYIGLFDFENDIMHDPGFGSSSPTYLQADTAQVDVDSDIERIRVEHMGNAQKHSKRPKTSSTANEAARKKNMTKEEKARAMDEKKLKKEQEKLQKAALKAEAAERNRLEKEKQKWEKGKLALKSIVAEIDSKVVELGSVGGHLLSRFSEKGIAFRITSNPIERSIVWTMTVPEEISQLLPQGLNIPYVLLVYEADEFYNLVCKETLLEHVSRVRSEYPSYTVCYLTNKLMAYINKREKEQYKNAESCSWRRPPIEEVLAKLTSHYARVHSRHCVDEAELAEHVVGLTSNLATCQFRKKLTRLSVSANGSLIPKDSVDKNLIKKSIWLKALIAIPKVQPRFALAVWKKYPTMKSLLKVYMDPSKSVHEKEFLLKDLTVDGLVGGDRRLGEVCSKRIYRVLMAQSGSIKTDDVEVGADFFRHSQD